MKKPKADGTTDPKNSSCSNWEDIVCDKCGQSCRDKMNMNFEFVQLVAYWGYGSGKDTEKHEAEVCEKCYDAFWLQAHITEYL